MTLDSSSAHAASRLAAIVESSDDAIISKSLEGVILTWNRGAQRIFGYTAEEVIGQKLAAVLVPPERRDEVAHILERVRRGERVDHFQTVRRRKDGTEIVISVTISPIHDERGRIVAASKVARDITSQTQAARERDRIFELSSDMLLSATFDGTLVRVNPAFCNLLGWSDGEVVGRTIVDTVHPDDVSSTLEELDRLRLGTATGRFENRVRGRHGDYRWLSWRSVPHDNGMFYAVVRDVTDDRSRQAATVAALREKEVLLQEIHHRVKNNLQVISSLINMQLRSLELKSAHDALVECQSRIQAIALIHERLYQSKDFGSVPFADYLRGLATTVFESAGVSSGRVALELDIGDVSLPVDKAIPSALILNELIINALKHGFPGERSGEVRVRMSIEGSTVALQVKDDGVGLPGGFDVSVATTLGLQLVTTLVEQLEGRLEIRRGNGATFDVAFALDGGEAR